MTKHIETQLEYSIMREVSTDIIDEVVGGPFSLLLECEEVVNQITGLSEDVMQQV
jgi:hypothetical protein